jgi:hypothetical protein
MNPVEPGLTRFEQLKNFARQTDNPTICRCLARQPDNLPLSGPTSAVDGTDKLTTRQFAAVWPNICRRRARQTDNPPICRRLAPDESQYRLCRGPKNYAVGILSRYKGMKNIPKFVTVISSG